MVVPADYGLLYTSDRKLGPHLRGFALIAEIDLSLVSL